MNERGQGLVEYALILILFAVVVVVCIALISGGKATPPPAMDAPLMDIVHYCDEQARESRYNAATKSSKVTYNPDKFVTCMQQYEYRVTR